MGGDGAVPGGNPGAAAAAPPGGAGRENRPVLRASLADTVRLLSEQRDWLADCMRGGAYLALLGVLSGDVDALELQKAE